MASTGQKPPGYAALRSAMLTRLEQASDLAVRPLPARPADATLHSAQQSQLAKGCSHIGRRDGRSTCPGAAETPLKPLDFRTQRSVGCPVRPASSGSGSHQ